MSQMSTVTCPTVTTNDINIAGPAAPSTSQLENTRGAREEDPQRTKAQKSF